MPSVYYIISATSIGGAEKRFIELWGYLQEAETPFHYYLVISEQLYNVLEKKPTISPLLAKYPDRIKVYNISNNGSVVHFQKKLYQYVCDQTKTDDILHFVLSFPTYIFSLKHKRTVYSLTESSLKNVNIKGKMLYLINILRGRIVDILDPAVYKIIKKSFFFKNSRISMTPGSFVDTTVFKPADHHQKENWFVFLGRFFYVKQVIQLLNVLPDVCRKLNEAGHSYKFIFLGDGQLQPEMSQIMTSPAYKNLPIEINWSYKPEEVLAKSKVFFSLQMRNNYPSKSLLEGIAAGNIPLVTDVGTTRLIARPEFSYYVPENFSADDIAGELLQILSLDETTLQEKMTAARTFISNNFTIQTSAAYYINLYKGLA